MYYNKNFMKKIFLAFKNFLKIIISFIVVCFIVKLCLKLFRLETSHIILEFFLKTKNKLPHFVTHTIFKLYENIEYYLWLFMYFFANFIEFVVYFLFKIKLNSRPYDFIGLLLICFFTIILCLLWSKKKV